MVSGYTGAAVRSLKSNIQMPNKRIYLAGPIQHVSDYGKGWREWLKDNRSEFEWADPLDEYNNMEEAEQEWTCTDIVQKDLDMIDESSGLLVHWDTVPTAGTPMEVFYAAQVAETPVVIQTTLHESDISPWIEYHADRIEESFDDAIDALRELVYE